MEKIVKIGGFAINNRIRLSNDRINNKNNLINKIIILALLFLVLSSIAFADLYLNSRSGNIYLNTSNSARLTITSSNVGIGTTTPNTAFEVNGTSTFGGDLEIPKNNINVGGGYSGGGVTLVGTGTDKGSGQFAKDILIDGAIVAVYDVEINKSFIPTKNSFVSLGNVTNKFLNLYVDNILNNGTITANTNLTLIG